MAGILYIDNTRDPINKALKNQIIDDLKDKGHSVKDISSTSSIEDLSGCDFIIFDMPKDLELRELSKSTKDSNIKIITTTIESKENTLARNYYYDNVYSIK